MLSISAPNSVLSVKSNSAGEIAAYLEKFNALMRAQIDGGGSVAVLLQGNVANRIVAGALGEEASSEVSIGGRDPATLREVFEPCLGGGTSFFKEKYGKVLALK